MWSIIIGTLCLYFGFRWGKTYAINMVNQHWLILLDHHGLELKITDGGELEDTVIVRSYGEHWYKEREEKYNEKAKEESVAEATCCA